MNSNKKRINYKVLSLFEIYNFYFGSFSIQDCLRNLNFTLPCALIWHTAKGGFAVCQRKAHGKFFYINKNFVIAIDILKLSKGSKKLPKFYMK